jgi:hypothetical protein
MNITAHMAGKVLEAALTDGSKLILRTTDGHEFRIEWKDGEPVLTGVDVRIVVALPGLGGVANI